VDDFDPYYDDDEEEDLEEQFNNTLTFEDWQKGIEKILKAEIDESQFQGIYLID